MQQSSLPTRTDVGSALSASSLLPPVIVIAIALLIHLITPVMPLVGGKYSERILIDVAIAMIAAVSLTMVNGFTGQFSIGHAAFMALGGYMGAWASYYFTLWMWKTVGVAAPSLYDLLHASPALPFRDVAKGTIQGLVGAPQWILLCSAIVGGLVAAIAGWVVGLPSLRLKGDYLAIVTLGFGEILRVILQQTNSQALSYEELRNRPLFGSNMSNPGWVFPPGVGGSLGFTDVPKVTNLFWAYLFVGITVLFAYRLKLSSYGRAMISIREDEIAAEAMGVNVTKLKVRAFMFAAFFAGMAGALFAHQPGVTLRPVDAGFQRSFDIVMMVVLGGLGSISGAVLAAIVITGLNALLLPWGPYRMIIFALALILLMIFRPQGLLGLSEVWDWFRTRRKVEPPIDAPVRGASGTDARTQTSEGSPL